MIFHFIQSLFYSFYGSGSCQYTI